MRRVNKKNNLDITRIDKKENPGENRRKKLYTDNTNMKKAKKQFAKRQSVI